MRRVKLVLAVVAIMVAIVVVFAAPAVALDFFRWGGRHHDEVRQSCGWYWSYWWGWTYWCWSPWWGWFPVW